MIPDDAKQADREPDLLEELAAYRHCLISDLRIFRHEKMPSELCLSITLAVISGRFSLPRISEALSYLSGQQLTLSSWEEAVRLIGGWRNDA